MLPAFFSIFFLIRGTAELIPHLRSRAQKDREQGLSQVRKSLTQTQNHLLGLSQMLAAGIFPEESRWEKLKGLAPPWGEIAHGLLSEARSQGVPLLPLVRRLETAVGDQESHLGHAIGKTAGASAQAVLVLALIPIFSGFLTLFLPEVSDFPALWWGTNFFAIGFGALGWNWILKLAERARFGGLGAEDRGLALYSVPLLVRLISGVQCGNSPDYAWTKMVGMAKSYLPQLPWSENLWSAMPPLVQASQRPFGEGFERVREVLLKSFLEGTPALTQVEREVERFSDQAKIRVEAYLQRLPQLALRPLFLCVAPGIVSLLGVSFFCVWKSGGL